MRKFFAWIEKPDNLFAVTEDDLLRYQDHLEKTYGSNHMRDHFTDICALFNAADQRRRFRHLTGGNPAQHIVLPPKRKGLDRVALTDDESQRTLLAVGAADPVVYWGHLLCAYLGTTQSEIADALVSHVVKDRGVWCLLITGEGRTFIDRDGKTQKANLKTEYRERYLPLVSAIRDRVLARVAYLRKTYGEQATLFHEIEPDRDGLRANRLSTLMMRLMRDKNGLNIQDPIDAEGKRVALRDARSWRKRFTTVLDQTSHLPGSTDARRAYLTGHTPGTVRAKSYNEHPPCDTLRLLEAMRDPLTGKVAAA